jgi:hypothetical protein
MSRNFAVLLGLTTLLCASAALADSGPEKYPYHLPRLAPPKHSLPEAELHVPKGSKIEEFRADGEVYMVKVIPPKPFPPYYLVDRSGKGKFTRVPSTDAEQMDVPQWVLLRW